MHVVSGRTALAYALRRYRSAPRPCSGYSDEVAILVNPAWFISRLRQSGSVEIDVELLDGDPAAFRFMIRKAAKQAGMRVHTRLTDQGMLAWDPDHVVSHEHLRAGNRSDRAEDA